MRVSWNHPADPDSHLCAYGYGVTVDGVEVAAVDADEAAGTATLSLIDPDGSPHGYVLSDYRPRTARVTGAVRLWMYRPPPAGLAAELVRPPMPDGVVRHSYASQQRLLEADRRKRADARL